MGHENEVLDIAFDCRGKRLATASSDSTARVWDVDSNFKLLTVMEGHREEVSQVCFSPAGTQLLTTSNDKTARLWNAETGCCLQVSYLFLSIMSLNTTHCKFKSISRFFKDTQMKYFQELLAIMEK